MIQLDRRMLHRFRAALRKSLLHGHRGVNPAVVVRTGPEGLSIHSQRDGMALAWQDDTPRDVDQIVLPADSLGELEGKGVLWLKNLETGETQATWNEVGFPRSNSFSVKPAEVRLDLPPLPSKSQKHEGSVIVALDNAMQSSAQDIVRFALHRIQLRGQAGEIVGTDGRQLLIQSGFEFGWKDNLLIERTPFFGWRELQDVQEVQLGCTDQQVCFVLGPWTLWMAIDKEGRFPNTQKVVPADGPGSRLQLDSSDATFLAQALENLPRGEDDQEAVTLDLNGHVSLRTRSADKASNTEVRLSRSTFQGPKLQISLNRGLLARALALGFREAQFVNAETPVVFHDGCRKFVITPFPKSTIVPAGATDVQIDSTVTRAETRPSPQPPRRKLSVRLDPKPAQAEARNRSEAKAGSTGFAHLLEEAQSLQTHLREALTRNHRLVADLKQYRRQAKAVQATLRQLRDVAA